MFNTLAYCLGLTSNGLTPIKETSDLSFVTKETDDQWTIVDIGGKNQDEGFDYPTPPPSPKMECSWQITPPPCFNADGAAHQVAPESPRENLLIEHPSIFVKSPKKREPPASDPSPIVQRNHKAAPASLRRSQRKAARNAVSALAVQQRTRQQFKHNSKQEMARRNNKAFQKMRQIVHQPRKRC